MSEQAADEIIAGLSAEKLESLVLALADAQDTVDRQGVVVLRIISKLTEGYDLGTGRGLWRAQLRIRQAIETTMESIPGMRYVEGDA